MPSCKPLFYLQVGDVLIINDIRCYVDEIVMPFIKSSIVIAFSLVLAACASQPFDPREKPTTYRDASATPEKRKLSEQLLQKDVFVLLYGPRLSKHTVEFYPRQNKVKIGVGYGWPNCYVEEVSAQFWVNDDYNNVSVLIASSKADCPGLRFNVDPSTGVSGGFEYRNGQWASSSSRYFLK